MNKYDNIIDWISALRGIRVYSDPFINIIHHNSNDTFVELSDKSHFAAYTTSAGPLECVHLNDSMLKPKEDSESEDAYYLFSINLKTTVLGRISEKRLTNKVIGRFIEKFGYMKIDVHIISREFRSSGDIEVVVVVADSEHQ